MNARINASKATQAQPSFPVRRMDYDFSSISKYWYDNDPASTMYFTALSLLFPEGEAFFVRAVRRVRDQVRNNPQLDKDIGAFIGQEAMHSKEHHAFHISAQQYGLNPESLERFTGILLKAIEKLSSKKFNLLATVGLEHYTAVKVVQMMRSVNEPMTDDTIRNLWLWHSVEETEHKAVAFDTYRAIYGSGLNAYLSRISVYTLGLGLILSVSGAYTVILMQRDRQLFNLKSWRKFATLFTRTYGQMLPQFLDYYRPSFHPNQTDEQDLVAQTKIKIGIHEADTAQLS